MGPRLWLSAPLALRHHRAVLIAVVFVCACAALAAASAPLVRAGVESESLRGTLRALSPYAAGVEIQSVGPVRQDDDRRAAARVLARRFPFAGPPVLTTMANGLLPARGGSDLEVVAVARTDVLQHVQRLASDSRDGVWISSSIAKVTSLHLGSAMRFESAGRPGPTGRPPAVRLRVSGIYADLDSVLGDPYWANFVRDIQPRNPNLPSPPPFVLMSEPTLQRVAGAVAGGVVANRFEFPVDPSRVTRAGALRFESRYDELSRELSRDSDVARRLGCGSLGPGQPGCTLSSVIDSAVGIAATNVAEVAPTVSFLSIVGLVLALGMALACGVFLTRRRSDEAQLFFARGERAATFAGRTTVEALLPAAVGSAAGFGVALLLLRLLAPPGTLDAGTLSAAVWRVVVVAAIAVAALGAGAAVAFPRVPPTATPSGLRRLRRAPWEIVPACAAIALVAILADGGTVTRDATGAAHPRVAVLVVPPLVIAALAGLLVRAGRRGLRVGGTRTPSAIFLAVRRLAAVRGVLVAVVVAAAAAFGVFGYAETLTVSLARSVSEKSFVANGSDVQGVIDPAVQLTERFPFPVAHVLVDWRDVTLESGSAIVVVAGDPQALRRTIAWGDGWADDPRPKLPLLTPGSDRWIDAIGTPGTPGTMTVVARGVRLPVRVVAHARFPGMSPGEPALLVSRASFERVSRRAGLADPLAAAQGFVWARGDPAVVEPALQRSSLGPLYLTRLDHLRRLAPVDAVDRTFRYLRVIGIVGVALSLLALVLYVQARQRSQLIASALARRMGLGRVGDGAALALEAAAIVLAASVLGVAVAVAAAWPLVRHLDPLPLYAPTSFVIVPWSELVVVAIAAACAAALAAALTASVAARADVVEALRVA